MSPYEYPADSPVLEPQYNHPCPFCGTVISGVWPDAEASEVTVKECYKCGEGPITVTREL